MRKSKYDAYWSAFTAKELTFYDQQNHKYLKKGYLHFDNRIWFPDFQEAFKKFILNPRNVSIHAFLPFLQVIVKTKRIKNREKRHKRKVEFKERPISYAAHFDALIYSFYSSLLSEKYERFIRANNLDENILAYRSLEKCNIDFANDVFQFIEKQSSSVAIALDIKGFFDNLSHEILKANWLRVLNYGESKSVTQLPYDQFQVFRSLTRFSFVDKTELQTLLGLHDKKARRLKLQRFCDISEFRSKVRDAESPILKHNSNPFGIPQGSPMSAVLSNIYMIDYDQIISKKSKEIGFCYRRYCDDIIVVCKLEDFDSVKQLLYDEIKKIQLSIQPEKEEVVHFVRKKEALRGYSDSTLEKFKNLQYLGFDFNGKNRYIRSSSLSRYHRRMKGGARQTVKRAYGNRGRGNKVFRYGLYDRFTHLGGQNFITYAHRAAKIMESSTIRKQIAHHVEQIKATVDSKTEQHLRRMRRKGKILKKKE